MGGEKRGGEWRGVEERREEGRGWEERRGEGMGGEREGREGEGSNYRSSGTSDGHADVHSRDVAYVNGLGSFRDSHSVEAMLRGGETVRSVLDMFLQALAH